MNVVDIGELRIHRFEEQAEKAIYLMYDGVHYNAAALQDKDIKSVFEPNDELVDSKMLHLAKELKQSGEWIDPNLFSLKCSDCGEALAGQIDAVEHAQKKGHTNFQQVEGSTVFD